MPGALLEGWGDALACELLAVHCRSTAASLFSPLFALPCQRPLQRTAPGHPLRSCHLARDQMEAESRVFTLEHHSSFLSPSPAVVRARSTSGSADELRRRCVALGVQARAVPVLPGWLLAAPGHECRMPLCRDCECVPDVPTCLFLAAPRPFPCFCNGTVASQTPRPANLRPPRPLCTSQLRGDE